MPGTSIVPGANAAAAATADGGGASGDAGTLQTLLSVALPNLSLDNWVKPFNDAGYQKWADLAPDNKVDTATKNIEAVGKDKDGNTIIQRGEFNRLVNGYQAAAATEAGKPIPDVPALPAGTTLDLTAPTISYNNQEWKIPTAVGASSVGDLGKVVHATDLTVPQWLALARNNNLTLAFRLDSAINMGADAASQAAADADSCLAQYPAFDWVVPASSTAYLGNDPATVKQTLEYTNVAQSAATSRVIGVAANFQAPYVSGSGSYSRSEKQAHAAGQKKLRMTGTWRFPRLTIRVDQCTVLSQPFTTEVKNALQGIPPGPAPGSTGTGKVPAFTALERVFERYGTAYASLVVVGGMLFFVSEQNATMDVQTDKVEQTIKAAVDVKITPAGKSSPGGGVSFEYGTGNNQSLSAEDLASESTFIAIGGDTTLNDQPQEWKKTIKTPDNWEVIQRAGVRPIIERFEDASLQNEVKAAWATGIELLWDGQTAPLGWVYPDMDGGPFTIVDAQNRPLRADGVNATAGNHALLSDPKGNNLLWRLWYSGHSLPLNLQIPQPPTMPIYWIGIYDSKREAPGITMDPAGLTRLKKWYADQDQAARTNGPSPQAIQQEAQTFAKQGGASWMPDYLRWLESKATGSFLISRQAGDQINGQNYNDSQLEPLFQSWLPTDNVATSMAAWTLIPADPGGARSSRNFQGMYLISGTRAGFLKNPTSEGLCGILDTNSTLQQILNLADNDFANYCWTLTPLTT